MRLFRRIPMILAIASTVTAMLFGGGVVVLAGDHEDCRHADADCQGRVHIVIVDEDGERHEESFHIEDFDMEEFEMKMEMLHDRLEDITIHLDEELDIPGLHRKIIARAPHRPLLGVQLIGPTPELREHMGAEPDAGVLVSKVLPGMPAREAGVQVGDLIVAVDGERVAGAGDLIGALRGMEGETIGLKVIRDGRPMMLDVFLPEREEQD